MATLTRERLLACPDNATVIEFLGASEATFFELGRPHGMDEGGNVFATWSHRIGDEHRCTLGTSNLLAHAETARIFALHWGRLTVAVRVGGGSGRLRETVPDRLVGETMDGFVDLSALGSGWTLYSSLDDELDEGPAHDPFVIAFELASGDPAGVGRLPG